MRFVQAAILSLALIAGPCLAIDPVNPKRDGAVYSIGPYPVPVSYEGVTAVLYTWLMFSVCVFQRSWTPVSG